MRLLSEAYMVLIVELRWLIVDVWDDKGNPEEEYEDWYCDNCKIRWIPVKWREN